MVWGKLTENHRVGGTWLGGKAMYHVGKLHMGEPG